MKTALQIILVKFIAVFKWYLSGEAVFYIGFFTALNNPDELCMN